MMSRLHHFDANKANLLYFGLGSESVIVIFANYSSMRCYYRACTSKLCMLTYRFYVLSNPVTPGSNSLFSEKECKDIKKCATVKTNRALFRQFNQNIL